MWLYFRFCTDLKKKNLSFLTEFAGQTQILNRKDISFNVTVQCVRVLNTL